MFRKNIELYLACSTEMGNAKLNIEVLLKKKGYSEICISEAIKYLNLIQRHGASLDRQIDAATECLESFVCVAAPSMRCQCFQVQALVARIDKL